MVLSVGAESKEMKNWPHPKYMQKMPTKNWHINVHICKMAAYGIKNGRILKKKQLHMQLLTLTTFKEIRSPHRSNASWRHLFFLSFGQKYIVEKGLYSLSHTGIHHPLKFLSKPDSEEGEVDHFLRCPSYFGPLQGGKAAFARVYTAPLQGCRASQGSLRASQGLRTSSPGLAH